MLEDKKNILNFAIILFSGVFFLIAASVFGILTGASDYGISDIKAIILSQPVDDTARSVIIDLRMPRVIVAAFAGAILSCGGLVFQAIFRNPLSEPYILGLSGGSGVGALIAISMGLARLPFGVITAFMGGMAALLVLFYISSGTKFHHSDSLVLSGVMINSFCGALIMFIISIARDTKIYGIVSWLMGDFSNQDFTNAFVMASVFIPCFAGMWLLSHSLNLISTGEELAESMGVKARTVTWIMIVLVSIPVSVLVSFCGLIGFVGLVVPHITRRLAGHDHRQLFPLCALYGGGFMVLCDLASRTIYSNGELPVGVITALIGSPFFIAILKRERS